MIKQYGRQSKLNFRGVIRAMSVLSTVSVCVGAAILLFLGIHTVISLVKAKKSGIVRTVYTAERKK